MQGEKITVNSDLSLNVPLMPIIPFIEGDGIGVDITPVMRKVVDAAVSKAYGEYYNWILSHPSEFIPISQGDDICAFKINK